MYFPSEWYGVVQFTSSWKSRASCMAHDGWTPFCLPLDSANSDFLPQPMHTSNKGCNLWSHSCLAVTLNGVSLYARMFPSFPQMSCFFFTYLVCTGTWEIMPLTLLKWHICAGSSLQFLWNPILFNTILMEVVTFWGWSMIISDRKNHSLISSSSSFEIAFTK